MPVCLKYHYLTDAIGVCVGILSVLDWFDVYQC